MFRVKGKDKQDHEYHVKLIEGVASKDIGAGIVLAAVYFEWCVRRCILALSISPVAAIRAKLDDKKMHIDELHDLWKCEVKRMHADVPSLSGFFDNQKKKPTVGGRPLTWARIKQAISKRNCLAHGSCCDPKPIHGEKYLETLLVASRMLVDMAESKKRSIFKIVRRHA